MKLWLLSRLQPALYDEYEGHVIRAKTEEEARYMASQAASDEGRACWLDAERTSCAPITNTGEPGVILSSYRAG